MAGPFLDARVTGWELMLTLAPPSGTGRVLEVDLGLVPLSSRARGLSSPHPDFRAFRDLGCRLSVRRSGRSEGGVAPQWVVWSSRSALPFGGPFVVVPVVARAS